MSQPSSRRKRRVSAHQEAENIVVRLPKATEDDRDRPAPSLLPVLCSFPGGVPTGVEHSYAQDSEATKLSFQWKASKQTKRKILVGKDHACVYTATNHDQMIQDRTPVAATTARSTPGEAKSSLPYYSTRMCVGIYDKQEKNLTLFEVQDDGYVYPFVQSVPNYKGSGDDANSSLTTASQQYKALYEDFGSAKKRRAIKSQEANKVNVESVVGAGHLMVDSVLKGESMSESNKRAILEQRENNADATAAARAGSQPQQQQSVAVDAATEAWRNEFLPPFDRNANRPFEIYNAVEIAGGPGLWQDFADIVEKSMNQQPDDIAQAVIEAESNSNQRQGKTRIEIPGSRPNHKWRPSLVNLVKRVVQKHKNKSPMNKEILKKQLVCAHVLHLMVHLYTILSHKFRISKVDNTKARYFGVPNDFGRFWVQSFTTESIHPKTGVASHVMSKPNKDKSCVSMLILLLMAEGGESMTCHDLQPFLDDLKMEARDASSLLRMAGCTVTRNPRNGMTGATLTAPLTFPALKTGNKNRKAKPY
ncbi:hypothetical protein ACA910_004926 [Epithemia clementina (nom. ined.)]